MGQNPLWGKGKSRMRDCGEIPVFRAQGSLVPTLTAGSMVFPGCRGPELPGEEGLQRAQGGHHPSGEFALRKWMRGEKKIGPELYQP